VFLDNNRRGYDVFVRTVLKNSQRKEVGSMWTLRTNGKCQTDFEMARALTHDLTRMGIPWQIRDGNGKVIEESAKKGELYR
jgi:hypothetical protein